MRMMVIKSVFLALLAVTGTQAFAPLQATLFSSVISTTSLQASQDNQADWKKAASTAAGAAFLAANILASAALSPLPAHASDADANMFGSSQVVAGRSGGRAGGRASYGGASRMRSMSSPSSSYRSTTIVRPTTVIRSAPSVYVAPPIGFGYGGGFGYNPLGNLATGYALGSMSSNNGDYMRDARQENEIQRSRAELEQARMKEAELEGRLRALESQGQQSAPPAPVPAATTVAP